MTTLRIIAVTVTLLFLSANSNATVIIAGTDPYAHGGFHVQNDGTNTFFFEQVFDLTSAANVSSFSVNAASFSAQTLRAELFSGSGLDGSGTLLETFDFNVAGGWSGIMVEIPTLSIARNFSLSTGTYSLLFTHPNVSSDYIYLNAATSSIETFGTLGLTNWSTGVTGGSNIVFALVDIVNEVPEPSTLVLAALGIVMIIHLRKQRAITRKI